jgi:hypothetical protein
VRKVGPGRTKLSVIRVNSVSSFCWTHNFLDLTLNPMFGCGAEIGMEELIGGRLEDHKMTKSTQITHAL